MGVHFLFTPCTYQCFPEHPYFQKDLKEGPTTRAVDIANDIIENNKRRLSKSGYEDRLVNDKIQNMSA